jgi:hypothetical protein
MEMANSMTPEQHTQAIRDMAPAYGEAKAKRVYLTEFKQSKKAMLMRDALLNGIDAASHQEREAYSSPEYQALIKGLAAAVEQEETLRWELESHRLDIEIFRTREATNRMQDRAHQ